MPSHFVEYEPISGTVPLRQGDVLEAVDTESSAWQTHLLVLTADCDFAYKKHQGRITCVPLLPADFYLLEMHIPRLREIVSKKPVADLKQLLTKSAGLAITHNRLMDWIAERATAEIVADLALGDTDGEQARRLIDSLKMTYADQPSLSEASAALVNAQQEANPSLSRASALRKVHDRLQLAFSQTPGDALFISAFAPNYEDGYFAYLRHLEQVWEQEVAVTPGRREVSYRRIARLRDRYIHALVQRFASVFMSIGLPDEYEHMRSFHSALITEAIQ